MPTANPMGSAPIVSPPTASIREFLAACSFRIRVWTVWPTSQAPRGSSVVSLHSILPTGDANSNDKLFFFVHRTFSTETTAEMTEPTTNQPADSPASPRFLPLVLLLFFGSGCAALIYEIVWFQLLQLVVGSSAVSLGVLLGTFMGGMCLGSLAL